MKTIELTGRALQHAVMLAEGWSFFAASAGQCALYGRSNGATPLWTVRGPDFLQEVAGDEIIDREGISVIRCDDDYGKDEKGFCNHVRIPVWAATLGQHSQEIIYGSQGDCWGRSYTLAVSDMAYGATRREAAMRAWVLEKLGAEVEIPGELA